MCAIQFPNSFRKHAGSYGRLLDAVAHTNTTVFLLPEWIRTYYEGSTCLFLITFSFPDAAAVNTDPLNGNFRDDADRKGKFKKGAWVPEDDPTAGANATALAAAAAGNGAAHGHCCYKCAGSSSSRASMLLVCDYCRTAWHMDCLDEPPTIPPGHTQKWRCPLHPESMVPGINKRIPRLGRTKPTDFVIYGPSDECDEANFAIEFDEDTDKRRRYVLPEHSIVLDFVRAVEGGAREEAQRASRRLPIKVDVPEDIRKAYDRAEADMSADRPTDSDVRLVRRGSFLGEHVLICGSVCAECVGHGERGVKGRCGHVGAVGRVPQVRRVARCAGGGRAIKVVNIYNNGEVYGIICLSWFKSDINAQ